MSDWAQIRAGTVLFEDDAALVLNKPAGLAVMGERHDTDLVRLAEEAGEKLYPAHRIDKVTSGALLLAKELSLHGDLTRQFSQRTVDKVYLAITATTGLPARGMIELPLSVGRKNRVRVAANRAAIAFDPARSRWSVPPDERFRGSPDLPVHHNVRDRGRRRGAYPARRLPGDRAPPPDPGASRLDRPSHRGRSAVRPGRGWRGPDLAAFVAARVRRGVGRWQAHPGQRHHPGPTSGRPCPAARSRCPAGTRSARTDLFLLAQAGPEENAERVPGRVGVNVQRLLRVRGAVKDHPGAKGKGPLVRRTRIRPPWSRTGPGASAAAPGQGRPGRLRQLRHLLEREADHARGVLQDQPVLARRVRLARFGGSSPGRYRQPRSCR